MLFLSLTYQSGMALLHQIASDLWLFFFFNVSRGIYFEMPAGGNMIVKYLGMPVMWWLVCIRAQSPPERTVTLEEGNLPSLPVSDEEKGLHDDGLCSLELSTSAPFFCICKKQCVKPLMGIDGSACWFFSILIHVLAHLPHFHGEKKKVCIPKTFSLTDI